MRTLLETWDWEKWRLKQSRIEGGPIQSCILALIQVDVVGAMVATLGAKNLDTCPIERERYGLAVDVGNGKWILGISIGSQKDDHNIESRCHYRSNDEHDSPVHQWIVGTRPWPPVRGVCDNGRGILDCKLKWRHLNFVLVCAEGRRWIWRTRGAAPSGCRKAVINAEKGHLGCNRIHKQNKLTQHSIYDMVVRYIGSSV